MQGVKVSTSNDINIIINGNQVVAGAQSYSTKFTNDTKFVDAFGHDTPIGYTLGKKNYQVDLQRVFLEDTAIADGLDFYALADNDFDLTINRNGKVVKYTNCIVSDISEDGSLNDKVLEKMTIMALNRQKM